MGSYYCANIDIVLHTFACYRHEILKFGGGGGGGEFDTRNPKSPYRQRGPAPLPHPPPAWSLRSLDARSVRSLAKLSSSFFQIFHVSSLMLLLIQKIVVKKFDR